MSNFPTSLPSYTATNGTDTANAAGSVGLSGLLNLFEGDITALATKIGTGAATPTSNKVLVGNGTGTSTWASTLAGLTLTTPTIADFSNATHTHANNAGGGSLNGANAITDGTLTPNELVATSGSSWVWTAFTPTYTNLTVGNGVHQSLYTQIGKTIIARVGFAFGSSSSMGTNPSFTLPVASKSTYTLGENIGGMRYVANSAGYLGYVQWKTTTDAFLLSLGAASVDTTITSSVPNTWGTTGSLYGTIIYEAA